MEPSITPRVDLGGGSESGREGQDVDGHEGASDRAENATPDSRSTVAANPHEKGELFEKGKGKGKEKGKKGKARPEGVTDTPTV